LSILILLIRKLFLQRCLNHYNLVVFLFLIIIVFFAFFWNQILFFVLPAVTRRFRWLEKKLAPFLFWVVILHIIIWSSWTLRIRIVLHDIFVWFGLFFWWLRIRLITIGVIYVQICLWLLLFLFSHTLINLVKYLIVSSGWAWVTNLVHWLRSLTLVLWIRFAGLFC